MNRLIRQLLEGERSHEEVERELAAAPTVDLEARRWLRVHRALRELFSNQPPPARQQELLAMLRAEPLSGTDRVPDRSEAEEPLEEELRGALFDIEPLPGGLDRLLGRLRAESGAAGREPADDDRILLLPLPRQDGNRDVRAASRDLPPEEPPEDEPEA